MRHNLIFGEIKDEKNEKLKETESIIRYHLKESKTLQSNK
jgi:hypothetical protein